MNISDVYLQNFEEVRRRSIMIWKAVPEAFYHWRPDKDAESFIEVIRHVLDCEWLFYMRIIHRGRLIDYTSPWDGRPLLNLADELQFATPFRKDFLDFVRNLSQNDLWTIEIAGQTNRLLSDYLLRAAYHEAVHGGQLLANLRSLGVERPYIWD